jgi:DNA polymerase III epsilon subunit-like protein
MLQETECMSPVRKKFKVFDFETTDKKAKKGTPIEIELNKYTNLAVDEKTCENFWFKNKKNVHYCLKQREILCVCQPLAFHRKIYSHMQDIMCGIAEISCIQQQSKKQ